MFIDVKRKYIDKELEHSFMKVWRYLHMKESGKLVEITSQKEIELKSRYII
jgi:hypoxanthine-guanine phosphoribosyltransferase